MASVPSNQPDGQPSNENDTNDQKNDGASGGTGIVKASGAGRSLVKKQSAVVVPLGKVIHYIDRSADFMTNPKGDEVRDEVMHFARPSIVFGIWTIIIVFGFFGGWAALAPIDSAAIGKGTIVVESNKKTIQHLEGGIIEAIYVKDGDSVKAGQPLIRMSETAAKSRQDTLVSQLYSAEALADRLIAERDGLKDIVFRQDLLAKATNPEVANNMDTQKRLFITRRDSTEGKINVLNERKDEYEQEIKGLQAQQRATQGQLKLVNDEVEIVDTLLKSGNANKPRLLALQRRQQELEGISGQYLSDIAKAKESITEADLQIINTRNDSLNDVMKELRDTQVLVEDLSDKAKEATNVFDRLVISSPQDGVVNGLLYHTVGGVIAAGTPIMDIIPQDDNLVIDAQISPQDIESVHTGLKQC